MGSLCSASGRCRTVYKIWSENLKERDQYSCVGVKGKLYSVAYESYENIRANGGVSPVIFNFDSEHRRVVSFMYQPLHLRHYSPKRKWTSETAWPLLRRRTYYPCRQTNHKYAVVYRINKPWFWLRHIGYRVNTTESFSGPGPVAGICGKRNSTSGSVKDTTFLGYHFLRKEFFHKFN